MGDYGGRITSIHSMEEWQSTLAKAEANKGIVCVDCYATWCPPCKAAAPVFAKMSETYTEESCIFAKVNVDEVRDVAAALQIKAMPTFKVFKGKTEVGVQQGWSEAKVKELIESNGAKRA